MRIDEDLLVKYDNYLKLYLKKTTYRENILKFKKYIFKYFKGRKIKKLRIYDIINWKIYINGFNFSYSYKSNLYYILCNFFDFLVKYYDIKQNYARIEKNFKGENNVISGNYWTIDEFNKFIKSVDDEKYKILFQLLYFSGMRRGELLALKWEDIDFNNCKININKSMSKQREIITTKTISSNREIIINRTIIDELEKFKTNDNDLIFDLSFTQLKRKKDYYCCLASVKQIKIHEFRHSHAIYLYQNNIPIDEISKRLGHAHISITTDTYLRYLPRDEKRVENLLNSVC